MIDAETGKHFDPAVVDAFHSQYARFVEIYREHGGVKEELMAV